MKDSKIITKNYRFQIHHSGSSVRDSIFDKSFKNSDDLKSILDNLDIKNDNSCSYSLKFNNNLLIINDSKITKDLIISLFESYLERSI